METGQEQIKPDGVFQGEEAGQPVLVRIVVIQLGLEAGCFRRKTSKRSYGFFQLIRFWTVFGVIDDEVFAPRLLQAEIAGARFGAW